MQSIMPNDARQLMNDKLTALGVSEADANIISDSLITASLCGIDTHGIRLLETYVLELENGRAALNPDIRLERETPVSSLMDAGNANGVVAGVKAMELAVNKAKNSGIGMVVVNHSNHFAAASIYTRLAAQNGLIGLCMSNSDALVALENGVDAFLGTNPIAFSAPGNNSAGFNLDFATSQVAYSKVMAYLAAGEPLPSGWATDDTGKDSSHNQSVNALKPLGGYKGQGLGFMVQMLTSVLGGMPYDHKLSHLYGEPYDAPRQVSHFMLAINPELFIDSEVFKQRVNDLLAEARIHSPEALVPGTQEVQIIAERSQQGIPLGAKESAYFAALNQASVAEPV